MNTTLKALYSALKPISDAGFDIEVKNQFTHSDTENILFVKINNKSKNLLMFAYDKLNDTKVSSDCNTNGSRVCDLKAAQELSKALSVSEFMHGDEFKALVEEIFDITRVTYAEISEHIEWAKNRFANGFEPNRCINDALPHNEKLNKYDIFAWEGALYIVADSYDSSGTILECDGSLATNNWAWKYQDSLHMKIGSLSKEAFCKLSKFSTH
ncbi:hypothetical protein OTK49_03420 [Vibrio coralliirubri]|uniref:hypothetical protein n=1 Tax=Vibrio coralliirubri TaxID=1516159 RepID=UPI002284C174|nr:hypothetical protein [Vibrio coralliirubri]MCY9861567.1 hypothetical protein [Vibrio coralliirubri]